jgi:hypothetical protein
VIVTCVVQYVDERGVEVLRGEQHQRQALPEADVTLPSTAQLEATCGVGCAQALAELAGGERGTGPVVAAEGEAAEEETAAADVAGEAAEEETPAPRSRRKSK